MKTLIIGGIKSGKSRHAEKLAGESGKSVTVIATALAGDEEMQKRIARHKASRPPEWRVIETPLSLSDSLNALQNTPQIESDYIIIDCLTLWITQLLCSDYAPQRQQEEIDSFVRALTQFRGELTMVSNETSMGIIPTDPLSRRYCDAIGILHQRIASEADSVLLMVAGLPLIVK